jgi:hypothetical protein
MQYGVVTNYDIDTARHCREVVGPAPQRMLHHAPAVSTLDTSAAREAHDLPWHRQTG